ncbi:hypothetical protein KVV02_007277 [Mortierella alpina]|uniref:Uncharacterized protein n=1 Tax=Mortierella alpina TaxID=64518 RepID=A0A9P7ZYW5_MORAP|nr:hypothetical protein KVV02_007277 [Mortierella alpina]
MLTTTANAPHITSSSTVSKKTPIIVVRRISLVAEPKQKPGSLSSTSYNHNHHNVGYGHHASAHSVASSSCTSISGRSTGKSLASSRRSSVTNLELHSSLNRQRMHQTDRQNRVYYTSDLPRGRPCSTLSSSSSSSSLSKTLSTSTMSSSSSGSSCSMEKTPSTIQRNRAFNAAPPRPNSDKSRRPSSAPFQPDNAQLQQRGSFQF